MIGCDSDNSREIYESESLDSLEREIIELDEETVAADGAWSELIPSERELAAKVAVKPPRWKRPSVLTRHLTDYRVLFGGRDSRDPESSDDDQPTLTGSPFFHTRHPDGIPRESSPDAGFFVPFFRA